MKMTSVPTIFISPLLKKCCP